ncbi:MAG TPA: DUF4190 domain-containing protein [Actinoplanes sp.]
MTTPPPPPPYYGPPQGEPYGPPPGGQNTQGLVGMILGIISIPAACCPYLGIPVGIVGLVFGWLGLKKASTGLASNRSQAMAGVICSAVGIVLGIAMLILTVVSKSIDWEQWVNSNTTT